MFLVKIIIIISRVYFTIKTYSQNLIVTENLIDGTKAVVDLSMLGTSPFQPKNKPQSFTLKPKKGKIDFCLVIESEGTANTLVNNGFTKRNNCIFILSFNYVAYGCLRTGSCENRTNWLVFQFYNG